MERAIGIFAKDSQVVRAVEALESHGFGSEAVRVIAGTSDQAQRAHSETDVPVERLYENGPHESPDRRMYSPGGVPVIPLGLAGGAYGGVDASGIAPAGSAEGYAAPLLGGSALTDDNAELAKEQLLALGLDDSDSSQCLNHIEHGDLLVVVDCDPAGRPYAESALREGGAMDIL
ncbi:hypothetical protein ACFFNY_31230 [Paenibacillus hodogayensis]|uniref:General stress protein 17M-like domain-containing protein n=1 Tax=Paenibacillus hodogayensis TaxID=279208 RepID=A0ABV5W672_9BACL